MQNIFTNYDYLIEEKTNSIEVFLSNIITRISLDGMWCKENSFYIELKKSFIRGILRYKNETIELQKILISQIKKNQLMQNYRYITPPYPMIHLKKDKVESAGGFHIDSYKSKDFITFWIPITNYSYPALSIFKFQNNIINIFSNLIIKSKLPSLLSYKLNVKKGSYYAWNGKKIHRGNLNTSDSLSCAFQFKLTKEVYEYEPSRDIFVEYKNDLEKDVILDDIQKGFNRFESNILSIKNFVNTNKFSFDALLRKLQSLDNDFFSIEHKMLSFSCSVLAQRLLSHQSLFSLNKINELSTALDLYSLVLGSDNLISLSRILKKFQQNNLNFFDFCKCNNINSIPYNSFQFNKLTKIKISKNEIYTY